MYRGEISIDEKDLSEILKVAEALSIRGLSSFESDDEDGTSEQQQEKSTDGSSSISPGSIPAPPPTNNQSQQQQPVKQTQTIQPANNQNDNQRNFYRHENNCDSNGLGEAEERKTITRGNAKKPKATHKVAFDTKTGLPVKRKRGRQPKNQSIGSSTVELRPPVLSRKSQFLYMFVSCST